MKSPLLNTCFALLTAIGLACSQGCGESQLDTQSTIQAKLDEAIKSAIDDLDFVSTHKDWMGSTLGSSYRALEFKSAE